MKPKNNQQAQGDENEISDTVVASITTLQFHAEIKKLYSEDASCRRIRAMLENARRGFFNGGIAPYGYHAVSVRASYGKLRKRIVPSASEAVVVSMAFSFLAGGISNGGPMSVGDLTAWLNNQGQRNRKGNLWSVPEIRRLLRNSIYMGLYRWNVSGKSGDQITVSVPSIVTTQTFYSAQKLLRSQKSK